MAGAPGPSVGAPRHPVLLPHAIWSMRAAPYAAEWIVSILACLGLRAQPRAPCAWGVPLRHKDRQASIAVSWDFARPAKVVTEGI